MLSYENDELKERWRQHSAELLGDRRRDDGTYERVRSLAAALSFWPPQTVQVPDVGRGILPVPFGGATPLRWRRDASGRLVRTLDGRAAQLVEHLRSADDKWADAFDDWARLGGECIEACHRLLTEITKAAEEETGLPILLLETMAEPTTEVLLVGFAGSVFHLALDPEATCTYRTGTGTNPRPKLCAEIASTADPEHSDYEIAYVAVHHRDRAEVIHSQLWQRFRQAPEAEAIRSLADRIHRVVETKLAETVDALNNRLLVPGHCAGCPAELIVAPTIYDDPRFAQAFGIVEDLIRAGWRDKKITKTEVVKRRMVYDYSHFSRDLRDAGYHWETERSHIRARVEGRSHT